MKNRIARSLAPLASLPYQRRFIVDATHGEYVLPEELVDSAISIVDTVAGSSTLRRGLTQDEVAALELFRKRIEDIQQRFSSINWAVNWSDVIERDEAWSAMRCEAARCLEQLGVSLAVWERTYLDAWQ